MNPIPVIGCGIFIGFLVAAFALDSQHIKENAEFEAKNCPQILQVDSSYCKPTEDN